jgi:hypothetical protein
MCAWVYPCAADADGCMAAAAARRARGNPRAPRQGRRDPRVSPEPCLTDCLNQLVPGKLTPLRNRQLNFLISTSQQSVDDVVGNVTFSN